MKPKLILIFLALWGSLARADVVHIDNSELERLMAQRVPVVDIRTEPEWRETGIVPGSRLLTFFDERGRADPAQWLNQIKPAAPVDKPIIVICRSGNRTLAVAKFLSEQAGYKTVYNVKYGIRGWIKESKPVINATPLLASCKPGQVC